MSMADVRHYLVYDGFSSSFKVTMVAFPFEVRFPTMFNDHDWQAHWAPPNERELMDPLYLLQRLAAQSYHVAALGGYTRSPHMDAPAGKVWSHLSHGRGGVEDEGARAAVLLDICHGIRIKCNDLPTRFPHLLAYFDGTITAQDLARRDSTEYIKTVMPDHEILESLRARSGDDAALQWERDETGTFVQKLLRLRPVYPIPRIAPPFPEAVYACVNGWNAMWAPPKGAKELDVLLLAQRLLKMEARLLTEPLPEDTTLLNKHLVEAVWDEQLLRLQSIFECLCGHPFLLRVVLCVDPVGMKCFEDGSVTSEDLCAPDHLQRITRIVTEAHARAKTPSSPSSPRLETAPDEQGPMPPQYYERFPPSVVAEIERVIAEERREMPGDVKEYKAIAAATQAAAAYPCDRSPDLHRAKTRWHPLITQYVPQDPVGRATLLDCLQVLSAYAAAVPPGACHAGLLRYVTEYAQGSLQGPSRAPSPPLPPTREQPPTPPMSPPPVQPHLVVDVHTQDEQDPQAHQRPQGGCWGWVCRTVRRAMDWLFGRKKK